MALISYIPVSISETVRNWQNKAGHTILISLRNDANPWLAPKYTTPQFTFYVYYIYIEAVSI